jgi:hypothetical protein
MKIDDLTVLVTGKGSNRRPVYFDIRNFSLSEGECRDFISTLDLPESDVYIINSSG